MTCFVLNSQNSTPPISDAPPGTYVPSQIIILYQPNTSAADRQAARDYYGITDFTPIIGRLEVWSEIDFPITVDHNGIPIQLVDEYQLLYYIHNNTTGGGTGQTTQGNGSGRANVQTGDYNRIFQMPNDPTVPPAVFDLDPLFACPAGESRIYGNTGPNTSNLPTIVLIDQMMTLQSPDVQVFLTSYTTPPGGETTHADKMAHTIYSINTANGLHPPFINLVAFEETGTATMETLLNALAWLQEQNYSNLIINFSASVELDHIGENSQLIMDRIDALLTSMNAVLVSSAGNSGQDPTQTSILPGGAVLSNEITVAGTRDCLSESWDGSNGNNVFFEIAAEADDMLAPASSTTWMIDSGTSYSACQVTAVLTQVASHQTVFNAPLARSLVLTTATPVAELDQHSYLGRVLDATAATSLNINFLSSAGENSPTDWSTMSSSSDDALTGEFSITVAPNPTSGAFTLEWNGARSESAMIQLYNELGQLLGQRALGESGQRENWSLQQLGAQRPGLYLLRIQQNDQTITRRIILQE